MLEVKTELVDKLKAENYEMTIILNTDQFKTIRNLEVFYLRFYLTTLERT